MSKRLMPLLLGALFVSAVGCKGCEARPKTLEVETRFAGGSFRKNWVVSVSGTSSKDAPLEGPVSLEASCGSLSGSEGDGQFNLVLGSLHAQLSCDTEKQTCCGEAIEVTARAGEIVASARAVADEAPQKNEEARSPPAQPVAKAAEPESAVSSGNVRTFNPWGGKKLDPGKVYLFATLSPPPGWAPQVHAFCDLEDPEHPAIADFWPYWSERIITPEGDLLMMMDMAGRKVLVFEPTRLIEEKPGEYSIDRKQYSRRVRETPGCKPFKLWLSPDTGELRYRCEDGRHFTEDRLSVFQPSRGEEVIAVGYGGLLLVSGNAETLVVDSKGNRHVIEDWRTYQMKSSEPRAVEDGFLFAGCTDTSYRVCFLNHIDASGRIEQRGPMAALPAGVSVSGNGVLDKEGNLYWIATRNEKYKGLVVKLPLSPGKAEVVFDDRDARPCDWSVANPYFRPVIWSGGGPRLVTGQ